MKALTPLELSKLDKYKKAFGAMTVAEAMDVALDADKTQRLLIDGDPAYEHFYRETEHFFNYAVLLERQAALAQQGT